MVIVHDVYISIVLYASLSSSLIDAGDRCSAQVSRLPVAIRRASPSLCTNPVVGVGASLVPTIKLVSSSVLPELSTSLKEDWMSRRRTINWTMKSYVPRKTDTERVYSVEHEP